MQSVVSHPLSHTTVPGIRLYPGMKIGHGDQYASTDGTWYQAPDQLIGQVIEENCPTTWLHRPQTSLSAQIQQLLTALNKNDGEFYEYGAIANIHGTFRLCVTPCYNPQYPRLGPAVTKAQINELLDHGLIRPYQDYCCRGQGIYVPTELGRAYTSKQITH